MSLYQNYPGSRPGPHAATHGPGGTDPLSLSAIGALAAANNLTDVASPAAARANLAAQGYKTETGNFTGIIGVEHAATATCTVTDPTTKTVNGASVAVANGDKFTVRVSAGTATVGGVGYSTVGTEITRSYNGGAWSNEPFYIGAKLDSPTDTPSNTRIVTEGDSNSEVARLGAGSWPTQLAALSNFSGKSTFYNYAVSGDDLSDMIARYAGSVFPNRPTGIVINSHLIFGIGTNDLVSTAVNTWLTNWESYVSTAVADGFTVWQFTIPRYGDHPEYEAKRQIWNQAIRENTYGVRVIDLDVLFPNTGQTNFYDDYIHLSAEANGFLAAYINNGFSAGGSLFRPTPPIYRREFYPVNGIKSNGAGGYLTISPAPTVGTASYTCAGWVSPVVGAAVATYIAGKAAGFGFAAGPSDIVLENCGVALVTIKSPIAPKGWAFLAVTRDSGTGNLKVYRDGVLISTTTSATASVTGPDFLLAPNSNGALANVGFWSTALSDQQVLELYLRGGRPPTTTNLTFFFGFEEGYGTTISGYGCTATVSGSGVSWLNAKIANDGLFSNIIAGSVKVGTGAFSFPEISAEAEFGNGSTYFLLTNGANGSRFYNAWGSGSHDFRHTNSSFFNISDVGISVGGGTRILRMKHGTSTLTAGTVTVSDTTITANSRIFVNRFTDGGTVGASYSITRTASTSFTITSKDGSGSTQTADTSVVAYQIIEP